jgi:hypothetical protein
MSDANRSRSGTAHERLHRRAAEVRARSVTRRWEYRQRHHAKGTWFRLRRVLAEARLVFVTNETVARQLLAEGFSAEPVGSELFPPKTLIAVPTARAEQLIESTAIPVRLSPELLAARFLVLVFWDKRRVDHPQSQAPVRT